MTNQSTQKFKYLENEKSFEREKKHFSPFLKGFQLPKIVSDLRVRFYIVLKIGTNLRKKAMVKKEKANIAI